MEASTQVVIDTNFRSALRRMQQAGRIDTYTPEADPEFQIAGMMKKLDGGPSLLFPRVKGHAMPVLGNMLSCRENCEAAFGGQSSSVTMVNSRRGKVTNANLKASEPREKSRNSEQTIAAIVR